MNKATVSIKGITPCIMHNGQTASPLNPFAKRMKEISGKRKKTDEDYEAMAKVELEAAFYLDEQGRPCWPGENIEALFIGGAKKLKMGPMAKSGFLCEGLWPIIHGGPKHYKQIMEDMNYIDARGVRVQSSRVIRTRPIFRDWALKFEVWFNAEIIDVSTVRQIFDICGEQIGLSDFRPKYGRFVVESFTV